MRHSCALGSEDAIDLWIVNELVERPASILDITNCDDREWHSYWDFPGRHVLNASVNERLASLRRCQERGFLRLMERSTGALPKRSNVGIEPSIVGDPKFFLALNMAGFDYWCVKFSPDWDRYWRIEDQSFSRSGETTSICVLAASALMAKALANHFCDFYWLTDSEYELTYSDRFAYGISVGCFKTIEFGLLLYWTTRRATTPVNCRDRSQQLQTMNREHTIAQNELLRLSGRWKCVNIDPSDRRCCDAASC